VRLRRERPRLRPHLIDREFFLGRGDGAAREIGVKLGVVVANHSLLPNALLGVRLWFRRADGSWQAADDVAFDERTPLPFNLPSSQTALLRLRATLKFDYDAELEEGNVAQKYLNHYLPDPRQLRLELHGLGDHLARHELTLAAKR